MRIKTIAVALGVAAICAANARAEDSAGPASERDKHSYGVGIDLGRNFRALEVEASPEWMMKGFKDGLEGAKAQMSEDDLRQMMGEFQKQVMEKQKARVAKLAADVKKQGDDYRADNGKKDGVTTLPNGIQYKVLTAADGTKPQDTDTVECNYVGRFIDGKEFDKSEPGKPVAFPLNGVIEGWREVLKLMPIGSKWQVVIPPELAYGERGAGREIPPNATLVFDIELVSIK